MILTRRIGVGERKPPGWEYVWWDDEGKVGVFAWWGLALVLRVFRRVFL